MRPFQKVGTVEKFMDIPKIWNLGIELWKLRKSEETSDSVQPGRKLLMGNFTAKKQYLCSIYLLKLNLALLLFKIITLPL